MENKKPADRSPAAVEGNEDRPVRVETGAGVGASGKESPQNGMKNFRLGTVRSSFVHKRDALGPKYPDSERGESRARASFLIDNTQNTGDRNNFNRMSLSPTLGEKTFTKTPRMTLGKDRKDAKQNDKRKGGAAATSVNADADTRCPATPEKKSSIFNSVLFSKHRNRR